MAVISFNKNAKDKHNSVTIQGNEKEIEDIVHYVRHMYDEPVNDDSNNDKVDMVNEPPHYQHGMECIDEMILIFGKEAVMNFCLCNCWKYRYRAPYKGNAEQDMEKSRWYLNKYKKLKDSTYTMTNTIVTNNDETLPYITHKVNDYPFNDHVMC